MIVYSRRIVRFFGRFISLGEGAMAITLYPFIFVSPSLQGKPVLPELLRHEAIHIRQQAELLVLGAWLLFLAEYLYARIVKRLDPRQAYYFTSMEQEAHRNAMKEEYLFRRRPYAMLRYLRDKKWLGRAEDGTLIEREY